MSKTMREPICITGSYIAAGDDIAAPASKFHTFPTLTRCSDGAFICAALVGSEKSGPDGRIKLFRSADGCRTWTAANSPTSFDEAAHPSWGYLMCHVIEISPGHLLSVYLRSDRSNADEPLFHPKTSGMQHTAVRLSESLDYGRSWSKPWELNYELPDLIVPGGFLKLSNGSIGIPFEVWHEWDKGFRDGPSTQLIVSDDRGGNWRQHGIIARDEAGNLIYGDPRLTRLSAQHLVALLWTHNFKANEDLPVHRTESIDDGHTWSNPKSIGLIGQIAAPASLGNGRMLAIYQKRFGADAGLRAVLGDDDGLTWDHSTDIAIWAAGQHTNQTNPFSGFAEFTFGYSSILPLSEEEVLIPFWVSNGKTTYVRILKLGIDIKRSS